ncbi:sodium:solute symporter family transporter [Cardinium endosymbiont of Oedothorax gibbosus]|uniref:sodium:solute symporter family transporter n=1 Tax=Cardinium endosymbiont of Oedothorax gibbosus TaxID=931101 RepID=UPI0020242A67|nr:HD domain-containing protein [Cardinium endosymbiont of Oedothorax gibbosus]CAH2559947.1 Sodium:solute symporter family protein [Cardinium endosymbiont of Oedothorax gibbosus]
MICFNESLFIVSTFLVLTLVVGIYFSRKETTFREYAVGNKQFATATLVATVLATLYSGGGLVFNVQQVYNFGLYWIILIVGVNSFSIWLFSRLMLRMGPFMQNLSIAETMGNVYGKYPRIITALVGICRSIVAITMQIIAMAQAVSMCVDLDLFNPRIITVFAALILIFYSMFGGVRAVTFTDILQFVTFTIIIPFLAWFMFKKTGKSIVEVVSLLQTQEKFQFSSLLHFDTKLVGMVAMALCIMVPDLGVPAVMQRVYMSSGPTQARRIFLYTSLFSVVISSVILLIGLFVFAAIPTLPIKDIWYHIMTNIPPIFRGMVCTSLLAMAMSTADSYLNSCAVMVGHDILESLPKEKEIDDVRQLKIARWTTLVVGLLSMFLTFYCKDLLDLLMLSFAFSLPVITAPALLAIFSFRGTSRTALIGMATGALSILAWNKWVKSTIGIDGAFICMLANALAMMAAHYLLKHPESAGWVGPDYQFKQIQQENARKRAERKEAIKNAWVNKATTLAKLRPSDAILCLTGLYIIATATLGYWFLKQGCLHKAICQVVVGFLFASYGLFTRYKTFFSKSIPSWFIGLCWLIGLALYFPIDLLWNWWHLVDPIFTASLFLTHCAIILWLLPLYLGIGVVAVTSLVAIYPIAAGLSFPLLSSLFPLFIASLLLFTVIICFKVKVGDLTGQILYLKDHEKIRENQNLKASLYEAALVSSNRGTFPKPRGYGFVLTQVVRKIEESISFLDSNMTLYKQDFQSIINKFYDWVIYFNKKERAKEHALLQPTKITLDKLIRKVEVALSQEIDEPPRLLVEKINDPNKGPCPYIVCDIHQVVYSLVQSVLRVGKPEGSYAPVVRIQLHPTVLQFKQTDPFDGSDPVCLIFQATALVISQATTPADLLPKVKASYADVINFTTSQERKEAPPSIDLQQQTISNVIGAHYGCLEDASDQKQPTMLLVLPNDVTEILGKITTTLPIDALTLETPVTPKEQADSMMVLMQFHDYVSKSSLQEDPIDMKTISGLLLLLRKHFGFKRHESGQLFYVRAVGIATLVVEWVFHSPKVIYAALLYGLVRRTCLPLSYIKEHYNFGVYAFVLNVVGIDKRQALDHPSLLHVKNRLKEAIKEEHVQLSVLFIKLAERLYDLCHAAGYIQLTEVQHMAQETLAIDVQIANTYLGPEIGVVLEEAAKQALEVCKSKEEEREKEKNKDKDQDS